MRMAIPKPNWEDLERGEELVELEVEDEETGLSVVDGGVRFETVDERRGLGTVGEGMRFETVGIIFETAGTRLETVEMRLRLDIAGIVMVAKLGDEEAICKRTKGSLVAMSRRVVTVV